MREWPDPVPVAMPITFNGKPVYQDEIKRYMEEWHLSQEEAQHVESFEEADNFEIHDDEESDFFHGVTPYEMHEMPENEAEVAPPNAQEESVDSNAAGVESNETTDTGASPQPSHDQSAPDAVPAPQQT